MAVALRRLSPAPPLPPPVVVLVDRAGTAVIQIEDYPPLALAARGIGARYLAAVARRAAAAGWETAEIQALVGEVDRRTVQWVAASHVEELASGPRRRRCRLLGAVAAQLSGGRWRPAAPDPCTGDALVDGAHRRHGLALAALAGAGHPRWARSAITRWAAGGARTGSLQRGARGWVLEAVSAPRVGTAELSRLREALAGAPRCGWCGTPVLGSLCRRCAPEDA